MRFAQQKGLRPWAAMWSEEGLDGCEGLCFQTAGLQDPDINACLIELMVLGELGFALFIAIKFTLLWLSLALTSMVINQDCTVVNFLIFVSRFLKWVMKNDVFTSSPPHLLTCWTLELVSLTSSLYQGKGATDDKCGFGAWQAWGWLGDTSLFATINLSLSKSFLSCHCWCLFHIMY